MVILPQEMIIKGMSMSRIMHKIEEQNVKKHLDIIIMKLLRIDLLSGYGIITAVHRQYGVLVGAGMVYNLLRSLEKRRIIKSINVKKARYYLLDKEGEAILEMILSNRSKIRNSVKDIF